MSSIVLKNDELTEKLLAYNHDSNKTQENTKNIIILNDELKLRDRIIQELRSLNQAYLEELNEADEKNLKGEIEVEVKPVHENTRVHQLYSIESSIY